jgi:hypothetical protein
MRRIGIMIAFVVAGLAITIVTGWGALVVFYLGPGAAWVRSALAWSFVAIGLVTLVAVAVRRARRPAALGFAVAFALVLVVWSSATPSNDRDWQPEVAVLAHAPIDGDRVTVHNIRNFAYRTETEFTPAYYDRTFDLRRLDRVDARGHLDRSLPFEELKRRSHINAVAQAADRAPDFSRRIRVGVP